jgi:hypothetical protein
MFLLYSKSRCILLLQLPFLQPRKGQNPRMKQLRANFAAEVAANAHAFFKA